MSHSRNLWIHPQNIPTTQQRQRKSPIPLFFLLFYFLCDLMPFNSCRVLRRGRSLVLVPKKSVALQVGQALSPDVAPVSGRSGADVAASSIGQALPAVVPVTLVGQAGAGAKEAP